jgi:hypothetical protein
MTGLNQKAEEDVNSALRNMKRQGKPVKAEAVP